MCYLFVHSERQREGGERVHLFVHKPWRRQRVCLFVCLLRLFVFFIRSSATATARLFIRLSAASVCFSLFHAPRRRRVYLYVCPWRLFVFHYFERNAMPRLRRCRAADVYVRFLFVHTQWRAAFVCPFIHACTQH